MARLRSKLLAACCVGFLAPAAGAATVTIDGDEPSRHITLTIRDASIGAALRDLGQTYGFEVRGAPASDAEGLSATISQPR